LVGIARAVALNPSVLLLDEPAAGLSATESRELGKLIQHLARDWKMAILLVEHDVDLVMSVCDRVAVLDFGHKIAEGTPQEVRSDRAVIAAYLGSKSESLAGVSQEPAASGGA
jgi:sulfate-transporting ATPase